MCQEYVHDGKWQVWANYVTGTWCIGRFDTKEEAEACAAKGDPSYMWPHWVVVAPEEKK